MHRLVALEREPCHALAAWYHSNRLEHGVRHATGVRLQMQVAISTKHVDRSTFATEVFQDQMKN